MLLLLNSALSIGPQAAEVDLATVDSCVPENSFAGMPLISGHGSNISCNQSYKLERYHTYAADIANQNLSNITISCTMLLKYWKDRVQLFGLINGTSVRIPRQSVTKNLGAGWYLHTYEYTVNNSTANLTKMYIYNSYHQKIFLNELECFARPTFGHERYVFINEEFNNSYIVNEDTELPSFILDVTHKQEARLLAGDKVKFLITKKSGVADYIDISCSNINLRYVDSSDSGSLRVSCEEHNGRAIPVVENVSGKDILSIEYFLDIGFEVSITDQATSDILNEEFKIISVFE